MKILFAGGKKGWAEYVIYGTKDKPRNKNLIKIIDGDPIFTKKIYEKLNYKNNYTKIVLSVKGKIENEKLQKIYEDFKALYFKNYENEIDISAVIHQDSNNSHVHISVPNVNLKTGRQQTQYLHRIDMKRSNNIRDYLILKYNLNNDIEAKKINIEELKTTQFIKPKMFKKVKNISRKRSSNNMQLYITNLIQQAQKQGLLNNKEQIINYINNNTLVSVCNANNGYITLQDEQQNKLKIYNEIFYNNYNFQEQKEIKKEETGLKSLLFNSTKNKLKLLEELIEKDASKQLKYIQKTTKKGVKNGTIKNYRESGGTNESGHNIRLKTIIKTAEQHYKNIARGEANNNTKLQQLNTAAKQNITAIKHAINNASSLKLLEIKTSNLNKILETQIKNEGIIKSSYKTTKNYENEFNNLEQQTPKIRDLEYKEEIKKEEYKEKEQQSKILTSKKDTKTPKIRNTNKNNKQKKKNNYEIGL